MSEAVRESMPAAAPGPRTRVVRYGVEAGEIRRRAPDRAEVRRRARDRADGEVVIGTVANLRATKGYPDLLARGR